MAEKGKNKKVQIAKLPDLIDICDDGGGTPAFLLYNEGGLEVAGEKREGSIIYIPPSVDAMPWVLPNAQEVIRHYKEDDDAKLFEDIMMCLRSNTELPDPNLYSFLTAWILHTHIIENFTYSPIVIFYAVAARGKTRTGSLLTWMARRGLHVETISEPDIFRKADRFCCTTFIDVADIWKKAERRNSEDILLSRYRRGLTIARVTNPDKNGFDDTKHFRCFGPTIIASNEAPSNLLESRGVNIRMIESGRQFDNDINEDEFSEFRERCTAFRARWLNRELDNVPKPANHRLGDILRPIAQVITAIKPDKMSELTALIKVFREDHTNVLASTPEGKIIKALLSLEIEVVRGIILTDKVTGRVNEGINERYHMSSGSVGKRLSSLGFKTGMVSGERGFYYDKDLLNKSARDYGCLDEADKTDTTDVTDTKAAAEKRIFEIIGLNNEEDETKKEV